jgi:hypothetical protein
MAYDIYSIAGAFIGVTCEPRYEVGYAGRDAA